MEKINCHHAFSESLASGVHFGRVSAAGQTKALPAWLPAKCNDAGCPADQSVVPPESADQANLLSVAQEGVFQKLLPHNIPLILDLIGY